MVIFAGVYLLNLSRSDPEGRNSASHHDGIATDVVSGIQTRRSMQARRSSEPQRFSISSYGRGGDREGLIHAYDVEEGRDRENAFGLEELTEDSDEDVTDSSRKINGNGFGQGNGKANANVGVKRSFSEQEGTRKASPLPR